MNSSIDIVIPWLNPTEKWFSQYKNYCGDEDPARIRDLNTIRPAIKSILKNLPWIRYIWLIVFDEEQHTNLDWEELKNDKVKFVYHRDIIPQEFLPNFNSMIVECFAHKIEGLAENFIWTNDDMIFVKPIPQEFYFNNDNIVHRCRSTSLYPHEIPKDKICMFHYICDNTANFISTVLGKRYWTNDFHMPIPLKKSLIEFLWTKYEKEFMNSCRNSKVRKPHNFSFYFIPHTIIEVKNMCEFNNLGIRTSPIWLSDNTTKEELKNLINNNHIVCLNDTELLKNKADTIASYIKEVL